MWQISASAWSPNGRYLVLSAVRFDAIEKTDVALWDIQTQTLDNLTDGIAYSTFFQVWSPSADKMLLSVMINGPEMHLGELDINMKEIRLFEGIPYLSFGVKALGWREFPMLTNQMPVATDIKVSNPLLSENNVVTNETISTNGDNVIVSTVSVVKIRSGPGTSYPVVGEIEEGAELVVLGTSIGQDWLQIQHENIESGIAWIFASLTNYEGSNGNLPVIQDIHLPP